MGDESVIEPPDLGMGSPVDEPPPGSTGFKKRWSPLYFALVSGAAVAVIIAIAFLLLDDGDDPGDEVPTPAASAADATVGSGDPDPTTATTVPAAASTPPGSADRLRDLFVAVTQDDPPFFDGLAPSGDVLDQPTAADLWFDLQPYTDQFAGLGYQDGQTGAFVAEAAADGAQVSGELSSVSFQRWQFPDATSAEASFDVYRAFVEMRAPVAEEGTVAAGDGGVTLLSRTTVDPVLSTTVTLARMGDVVLMVEGYCQGCPPAVEEAAFGEAETFAAAFFAP